MNSVSHKSSRIIHGYCTICTTAGNDEDFLDEKRGTLLLEDSVYGAFNIGFFIMGHNAYAAAYVFVTLRYPPILGYRSYLIYDLRCHRNLPFPNTQELFIFISQDIVYA